MGGRLAMRATSLSVAALLLGVVVITALSMRFITWTPELPPGPIFDTWREPKKVEPPKLEPPRPLPPRPIEPPTRIQGPAVDPLAPEVPTTLPTPPNAGSSVAEGPIVITRPDWLQRPTPAALARYYPERARDRGREGVVQLDCIVRVDGRLNCAVASETPSGWQFGDAALRISRDYRMVPATHDGVPVQAAYRMRVPFSLN